MYTETKGCAVIISHSLSKQEMFLSPSAVVVLVAAFRNFPGLCLYRVCVFCETQQNWIILRVLFAQNMLGFSLWILGSHHGQFNYLEILQCEKEKLNGLSEKVSKAFSALLGCMIKLFMDSSNVKFVRDPTLRTSSIISNILTVAVSPLSYRFGFRRQLCRGA